MTTLSIGICSTADHHFEKYASIVERSDRYSFAGIAGEDADRCEAAARRHGTEYRPTDAVLERADAVLVFSKYVDRREWIERAAASGVDVLCEKPLATTVSAAEGILETCDRAGVTLGMLMPLRFAPALERARRRYRAGAIGELQSVIATNRCAFRDRDTEGWTADPAATGGGGSVVHHSEHVVDAVRWLTGSEFADVHAELGYRRDLPVEDANLHLLTLENGATVSVDTSWTTPDEGDFWGDATVELIGTDGTISVDCFAQTIRRTTDRLPDPGIDRLYWGTDLNERVLEDFADAITAGESPRSDGRDGLRQVEVIEASYESADRGGPVTVGSK